MQKARERANEVYFPLKGPDKRAVVADGYSNGKMFHATWRAKNVAFNQPVMELKIDQDEGSPGEYSAGEYQTKKSYRFGLYECRLQPIKNAGVVSSFFIYTGKYEGNPWDEIDIEFLGKNTTQVQFNYFTNGVGNHEYIYDLGFDAAAGMHTYGFEWQRDSITWYVDGEQVHKVTENIPQTPGRVMMNVWPGVGVDEWLHPFDGRTPLVAKYAWFKITPYEEIRKKERILF